MSQAGLLFQKNLGEVHRPIRIDPSAYSSQPEIRIEDIAPVARTVHPPVKTRRNRVDVAVRISEILTHHSPLDLRLVNSFANRAAVGISVRKEPFFSHAPAVLAGDRQKIVIKGEGRKPASASHPVDLIQ